MQIGGTILEHAEKWAETVDDFTTLKHIRSMLKSSLEEHQKIQNSIDDKEVQEEFSEMFKDEVERCQKMIDLAEHRMKTEYEWVG